MEHNRHYIINNNRGLIIDGWSDGPHPERNTTNAICINERGGYQFRLIYSVGLVGDVEMPPLRESEENPPLYSEDGIPLYTWGDGVAIRRTEDEIEADRAAIPAPEPAPSLEDRVNALETETAAISAAIERGFSL